MRTSWLAARRPAPSVVLLACACLVACGGDRPVDVAGAPAATSAPDTTAAATSAPVTRSPDPTASSTSPDASGDGDGGPGAAPALAATVNGTYPRFLLDRGMVNVRLTNDGAETVTVVEKQLVSTAFTPAAIDRSRTSIVPAGRSVNLQTSFGVVSDCDDPAPVSAVARLRLRVGDAPAVDLEVPVDEPVLLDEIRARACAAIALAETADAAFESPVRDGQQVVADLVLRRIDPARAIRIESVGGTVIFQASATRTAGDVLADLGDEARIPVTFRVARCDPHAIAESTKQVGADAWIGVDGGAAHRVALPIDDALRDELLEALEECKAAAAD